MSPQEWSGKTVFCCLPSHHRRVNKPRGKGREAMIHSQDSQQLQDSHKSLCFILFHPLVS